MTPIEIARSLPRNVGSKLFMHFKHPTVEMIQDFWKEPRQSNEGFDASGKEIFNECM